MSPSQISRRQADNDAVAAQIRATGARATPARIRVLQLLRDAPAALTHHDIEAALGDAMLDRVTLYRVLDWLVESGLAHKSADASRVYRFSLAAPGEHTALRSLRSRLLPRRRPASAARPARRLPALAHGHRPARPLRCLRRGVIA